MAKKTMGGSMWVQGLLVLALIACPADAITCQDAKSRLIPCKSFLTGSDSITESCCDGAKKLNAEVTDKADRQAVCECFKEVAPSLGIKADKANELLKDCSIDVGLPITQDIDCTKV